MAATAFAYDVRRVWPEEWNLLPLLTGATKLPEPEPRRYLHPGLEVRRTQDRGRAVFATDAIALGTLLLLDTPVVLAANYDELVKTTMTQAKASEAVALALRSMEGGGGETEAAEGATGQGNTRGDLTDAQVRMIIRRNHHAVEPAPVDGELKADTPMIGLWPLASLINTSLRPNVTRTFAGHAVCYRVIRPVSKGDEIVDNYLDVRLPHATRQELLRANYDIDAEGPDEFDAPADIVRRIRDEHLEAVRLHGQDTLDATKQLLQKLADLTNQCDEQVKDPAFHDIFRDFAIAVGKLGDANLCIQGLAQAFERATVREPYSVFTVLLTLRMLHMACLAPDEVDSETRESSLQLATEHFKMVYGSVPGAFEALNPLLTGELESVSSASATAPAGQVAPTDGIGGPGSERGSTGEAAGQLAEKGEPVESPKEKEEDIAATDAAEIAASGSPAKRQKCDDASQAEAAPPPEDDKQSQS